MLANENNAQDPASRSASTITDTSRSTPDHIVPSGDAHRNAPVTARSLHFGNVGENDKAIKVLLAIANSSIRTDYAERIRRTGLAVIEVSDGLACLQHLRMNFCSLLIVDVDLPWGNSDGIIEVLLKEDSIETIPTILVTFAPIADSDCRNLGITQRSAEDETHRLIERHVNRILPSRSRVSLPVDAPREVAVCRGELVVPDDEDTVVEEDVAALWRPERKSQPRQSISPSVLIAIANQEERRRCVDAFQAAGYRVSEATDGLSCLSALRTETFVILVLDQHLLWGSGNGVVEVMQNDPTISSVPVDLLNFPKPDDYDTKPILAREFVYEEIVQIVRKRLAGNI